MPRSLIGPPPLEACVNTIHFGGQTHLTPPSGYSTKPQMKNMDDNTTAIANDQTNNLLEIMDDKQPPWHRLEDEYSSQLYQLPLLINRECVNFMKEFLNPSISSISHKASNLDAAKAATQPHMTSGASISNANTVPKSNTGMKMKKSNHYFPSKLLNMEINLFQLELNVNDYCRFCPWFIEMLPSGNDDHNGLSRGTMLLIPCNLTHLTSHRNDDITYLDNDDNDDSWYFHPWNKYPYKDQMEFVHSKNNSENIINTTLSNQKYGLSPWFINTSPTLAQQKRVPPQVVPIIPGIMHKEEIQKPLDYESILFGTVNENLTIPRSVILTLAALLKIEHHPLFTNFKQLKLPEDLLLPSPLLKSTSPAYSRTEHGIDVVPFEGSHPETTKSSIILQKSIPILNEQDYFIPELSDADQAESNRINDVKFDLVTPDVSAVLSTDLQECVSIDKMLPKIERPLNYFSVSLNTSDINFNSVLDDDNHDNSFHFMNKRRRLANAITGSCHIASLMDDPNNMSLHLSTSPPILNAIDVDQEDEREFLANLLPNYLYRMPYPDIETGWLVQSNDASTFLRDEWESRQGYTDWIWQLPLTVSLTLKWKPFMKEIKEIYDWTETKNFPVSDLILGLNPDLWPISTTKAAKIILPPVMDNSKSEQLLMPNFSFSDNYTNPRQLKESPLDSLVESCWKGKKYTHDTLTFNITEILAALKLSGSFHENDQTTDMDDSTSSIIFNELTRTKMSTPLPYSKKCDSVTDMVSPLTENARSTSYDNSNMPFLVIANLSRCSSMNRDIIQSLNTNYPGQLRLLEMEIPPSHPPPSLSSVASTMTTKMKTLYKYADFYVTPQIAILNLTLTMLSQRSIEGENLALIKIETILQHNILNKLVVVIIVPSQGKDSSKILKEFQHTLTNQFDKSLIDIIPSDETRAANCIKWISHTYSPWGSSLWLDRPSSSSSIRDDVDAKKSFLDCKYRQYKIAIEKAEIGDVRLKHQLDMISGLNPILKRLLSSQFSHSGFLANFKKSTDDDDDDDPRREYYYFAENDNPDLLDILDGNCQLYNYLKTCYVEMTRKKKE